MQGVPGLLDEGGTSRQNLEGILVGSPDPWQDTARLRRPHVDGSQPVPGSSVCCRGSSRAGPPQRSGPGAGRTSPRRWMRAIPEEPLEMLPHPLQMSGIQSQRDLGPAVDPHSRYSKATLSRGTTVS